MSVVVNKPWSLIDAICDVEEFHRACDLGYDKQPSFPPTEVQDLRIKLIKEECAETLTALAINDLTEIADGLADIIYVCIGTALEYGIPLEDVWDEVHRSNMAKVDPVTGKVARREDGKILKPPGWTPPDIKTILEAARK